MYEEWLSKGNYLMCTGLCLLSSSNSTLILPFLVRGARDLIEIANPKNAADLLLQVQYLVDLCRSVRYYHRY